MSKHFGTDINAQLTEDLRHTLVEATFATVLLDEVRAMDAETRRAWLRTASAQQIERLAVCYAVEAEDMNLVAEFVTKLTAKQAELWRDGQSAAATPMAMPPRAHIEAAADELLMQEAKGSRRYNAAKRALLLTGEIVVFGAGVLMPSASGEAPYFLNQVEDAWACDCRAGIEHGVCKHALRMELIDRAWKLLAEMEAEQPTDDGEGGERIAPFGPDPAATFPAERAMVDTGATLGARLARARRAIAA
jgi:hypothetical protein